MYRGRGGGGGGRGGASRNFERGDSEGGGGEDREGGDGGGSASEGVGEGKKMPKAKMETRVETLEKSVASLEESLITIQADHADIKTIVQNMAKGKSSIILTDATPRATSTWYLRRFFFSKPLHTHQNVVCPGCSFPCQKT
ncbi:hypothetical protein JCGZ_05212 [Jatropha curcas]|uniref:Uncharacterized protein n=1 Tax=Jatropha curcas TaxID=180498 RepID=A0A067KNQ3_JATCU|nr:hypothetical protein JCGZ_05212 [Jatropha curcas]